MIDRCDAGSAVSQLGLKVANLLSALAAEPFRYALVVVVYPRIS